MPVSSIVVSEKLSVSGRDTTWTNKCDEVELYRPLGSLNRVPAAAGVKGGILSGGRQHYVTPCGM